MLCIQWTTWAWLYWKVLWRVYHKIVLRAIIGHFKSVEKRVGSVVKRKEKVLQYSDSERMFGIFIKYALYLCVNGKCASRRVMKIHAGHVSAASPCITYISLSLLGWRGRGELTTATSTGSQQYNIMLYKVSTYTREARVVLYKFDLFKLKNGTC